MFHHPLNLTSVLCEELQLVLRTLVGIVNVEDVRWFNWLFIPQEPNLRQFPGAYRQQCHQALGGPALLAKQHTQHLTLAGPRWGLPCQCLMLDLVWLEGCWAQPLSLIH